jgi:hypothetical protein
VHVLHVTRSVNRVAATLLFVVAGTACGAQGSTRVYPLPSDGWRPGQPAGIAIFTGIFDAELTSQGACAWLGPGKFVNLWPVGWGVRFHPTELIGPDGKVLAKKGQRVGFRGLSVPPPPGTTRLCGDPGRVVVMFQGP